MHNVGFHLSATKQKAISWLCTTSHWIEREEVGKKDLCLLGKLNSKMRDREQEKPGIHGVLRQENFLLTPGIEPSSADPSISCLYHPPLPLGWIKIYVWIFSNTLYQSFTQWNDFFHYIFCKRRWMFKILRSRLEEISCSRSNRFVVLEL